MERLLEFCLKKFHMFLRSKMNIKGFLFIFNVEGRCYNFADRLRERSDVSTLTQGQKKCNCFRMLLCSIFIGGFSLNPNFRKFETGKIVREFPGKGSRKSGNNGISGKKETYLAKNFGNSRMKIK